MVATAPLQVLLFRRTDDKDLTPVADAIVSAFQGSTDPKGYLAAGAGVSVTPELFEEAPIFPVGTKLDAACHTLVIVLVGRAFHRALHNADDATLRNWLSNCWAHVDQSADRHRMLVFPVEESMARDFSGLSGLDSLQIWPLHKFDEYALQSTMVALLALHEAHRLLALSLERRSSDGQSYGRLRFFISHAKIDALPLARALKDLIHRIPWLRSFYDADDLLPGMNWKRELEQGVASSLIIVLRTDIYDTRYWCQQEITWADQYGTPAVLVDARTALNNESSALPFTRLPIARVPDGNLMRILSIALREGVKYLLFKRRAEEMKLNGPLPRNVALRVFSYPPSMRALLHACRSLQSANLPEATQKVILYPDPPLPEGEREAALALLDRHAPKTTMLVTPQTLIANFG
jgi:hypothetical protein